MRRRLTMFLVIGVIGVGNAQTFDDVTITRRSRELHLNQCADSLTNYIATRYHNDKSEIFYPFSVNNIIPKTGWTGIEKDLSVQAIGFTTDSSKRINCIYFSIKNTSSIFAFLTAKYGRYDNASYFGSVADAGKREPTAFNWVKEKFVVTLYINKACADCSSESTTIIFRSNSQ